MKTNFDYDLWTTYENGVTRYWTRVKATREVCEINYEIMKEFRRVEKAEYRETMKLKARNSHLRDNTKNEESGKCDEPVCKDIEPVIVSSNMIDEWALDLYDLEEEISSNEIEKQLIFELTPTQKNVYFSCMKNGISFSKFAEKNSMSQKNVSKIASQIRNKAKNIFF